ncbi:MAG: hypothetical protein ACXWHB_01765 [Usitatibacter sp.]
MKRWIPLGVLALAAILMIAHGPIPQLDHYHDFADKRPLGFVPNAGDVLSNAGFAIVGVWGMAALRREGACASLAPGWRVFLAAIVLTSLGSGFYHLAPDNGRLVWDRLPIALACAGLLSAVHEETHAGGDRPLLAALVAAAIASVVWWSATEARGEGDLRPYLLMQAAPLVMIPLWQWIHGAPRGERVAFGAAIALYVLAKVSELEDIAVFRALGFMSGHTLKHLLAVAASAVLVANLVFRKRRVP